MLIDTKKAGALAPAFYICDNLCYCLLNLREVDSTPFVNVSKYEPEGNVETSTEDCVVFVSSLWVITFLPSIVLT